MKHFSNALDKIVGKCFHLFEGPYKIVRRVGENAFALTNPQLEQKEKGIYNRLNFRKYYSKKDKDCQRNNCLFKFSPRMIFPI